MAPVFLLSASAAALVIAKISTLGAGVWLGVTVDERLGVVVDETDGLELILIVGVWDGVILAVVEILGVFEAVAPVDREGVGVGVGDGLEVFEGVGVGLGVLPKESEAVWLGVCVGVADGVVLGLGPAASLNPGEEPVYGLLGPLTVICAVYVVKPLGVNVIGKL
jgi:hypothetical protein